MTLTRRCILSLIILAAGCGVDSDTDGPVDAGSDTTADTGGNDTAVPDTNDDDTTGDDTDGDDTSESDTGEDTGVVPLGDYCTGRTDTYLAFVQPEAPVWAAAAECAGGECADDECLQDCVSDATGLSFDCAGCFVEGTACLADECETECADAESTDCADCFDTACAARYAECRGTPDEISAPATFNVVHAAPGADPISVWNPAIRVPMVDSLAFGEFNRAQTFASGDPIQFKAAGADSTGTTLAEAAGEFPDGPGGIATIALYGTADAVGGYYVREDVSDPPDGGVRYRFFNGVVTEAGDDIEIRNVTESSPGTLAQDAITYGTATEDAAMPTSGFVAGVDVGGDGTVEAAFDLTSLDANSQHTFWVVSDEGTLVILDSTQDGTLTRRDAVTE